MDFLIRFEPSQKSVRVTTGTTLLDAARHAGLPVANSCGADGICGRCGLTLLDGAEDTEAESKSEQEIKERNRIDPELRLACRVEVRCDLTVTAPYW
jgi:ferredoxin